MSGYSYETMVWMVGRERADQLFAKANVEKKPDKKKDPHPEYTKLSEGAHGKLLHKHLDKLGLKHTHIGNESGQSGTKNIVIMMAKKKAQGTSKGFPDYIIKIPIANNQFISLYIELKKARGVMGGLNGSTIDPEQVEWQETLCSSVCSFAHFCHGSDEAIELVDEYVKKFKDCDSQGAFNEWVDFISNNTYQYE